MNLRFFFLKFSQLHFAHDPLLLKRVELRSRLRCLLPEGSFRPSISILDLVILLLLQLFRVFILAREDLLH